MKKVAIILSTLIVSLSLVSCTKNNNGHIDFDKIYKAVLIIDGGCTRTYGCVIIDGEIDPALVEKNWQYNGETYQKAFAIQNGCEFPTEKVGREFSFRITERSKTNDCMQCYMSIPSGLPNKSLAIKVIK